jgi:hypothetical protein
MIGKKTKLPTFYAAGRTIRLAEVGKLTDVALGDAPGMSPLDAGDRLSASHPKRPSAMKMRSVAKGQKQTSITDGGLVQWGS